MRVLFFTAALLALLAVLSAPTACSASAGSDLANNDIATLNFALTLERLELAFYVAGQAKYTNQDFLNAGYAQGVYDYFNIIKEHERAHVTALEAIIPSYGGVAIGNCTYNLAGAISTIEMYVNSSIALESTGVSAYDGAFRYLSSPALQQIAASVATIEARHTSFLLSLGSNSKSISVPFPSANDTAFDVPTVYGAAGSFIVNGSCVNVNGQSTSLPMPIQRPNGVFSPSTFNLSAVSSIAPANAFYSQSQFNNDIVVLNYLLMLQQVQYNLQVAAASKFSLADYNATFGGNGTLYFSRFALIAAHELAHVITLNTTIVNRGSTVISGCTYPTLGSFTTVSGFIAEVQAVDAIVVSGMIGAINQLVDTGLQTLAATILTVEARHAAFSRGITGLQASVDNFDTAATPAATITALTVTNSYLSCPAYPQPTIVPPLTPASNDIAVLNYALTLEHLEAAFYALLPTVAPNGGNSFTANNLPFEAYNEVFNFGTQEAAHVAALTSTIISLGGTPVPNCTYNFASITTLPQFLAAAIALETTGVQAYDGAINFITNAGLQQTAATIATVEARHTAFLLKLNSSVPFPASYDTPLQPNSVFAAAQAFITSCPYTPTNLNAFASLSQLPIVRPSGVTAATLLASAVSSSPAPLAGSFYSQQQFDTDIAVLNYALTLENLESAFYNATLPLFTLSNWTAAYGTTNGTEYFQYFQFIRAHEADHVGLLTSVIRSKGRVAVPACTYNFSTITSVQALVATARILENTGVAAYNGAVNLITDTSLQQAAATIDTVEARHASYLNSISGGASTPNILDSATAPADIITTVLATGLIVNCPINPTPPMAAPSIDVKANDITTLNYALYLERLEKSFYDQGFVAFPELFNGSVPSSSSLVPSNVPNVAYAQALGAQLTLIRAHETAHVNTLANAILGLGGVPIPPTCTYNFSSALASSSAFLALAQVLENTGVQAYDGAINTLSDPTLQQVAATIATVEARHSAYLRQLIASSAYPNSLDTASAPSDIAAATSPFVSGCSFSLQLPVIRAGGVSLNTTTNTTYTTSPMPQSNAAYSAQQRINDIAALNYALTLEHLESNFYNLLNGSAAFGSPGFNTAAFASFYAGSQFDGNAIFTLLQQAGQHENAHVSALRSYITNRGGVPVQPCNYNFSTITTVAAFVATAGVLENTGVKAYDGAVNTIVDTVLQQTAATIATVEARHAAILNLIQTNISAPDTFDNATSPSAILTAVTQTGLLGVCGTGTPVVPSIVPGPPAPTNSPPPTSSSSSSSSSTGRSSSSSSSSTGSASVVTTSSSTGVAPIVTTSSSTGNTPAGTSSSTGSGAVTPTFSSSTGVFSSSTAGNNGGNSGAASQTATLSVLAAAAVMLLSVMLA